MKKKNQKQIIKNMKELSSKEMKSINGGGTLVIYKDKDGKIIVIF